jgi:hypothetical protein
MVAAAMLFHTAEIVGLHLTTRAYCSTSLCPDSTQAQAILLITADTVQLALLLPLLLLLLLTLLLLCITVTLHVCAECTDSVQCCKYLSRSLPVQIHRGVGKHVVMHVQ